jgi:beta-galactosidase
MIESASSGFLRRLLSRRNVALQIANVAFALIACSAAAAPQSYPIDITAPPKAVTRSHLDLGGTGPDGHSIAVNSYYIEKDGKPFIPIVGEFHFSRYPAQEWEDELRKMKAGGINIVAT